MLYINIEQAFSTRLCPSKVFQHSWRQIFYDSSRCCVIFHHSLLRRGFITPLECWLASSFVKKTASKCKAASSLHSYLIDSPYLKVELACTLVKVGSCLPPLTGVNVTFRLKFFSHVPIKSNRVCKFGINFHTTRGQVCPLTERLCCCAVITAALHWCFHWCEKSTVIQQEEASITAGAETFTSRARTQPGSGRHTFIAPLLLEGFPGDLRKLELHWKIGR